MNKSNIENVITFLKPDFVFSDDRGSLRQLVRMDGSKLMLTALSLEAYGVGITIKITAKHFS